VRDNGGGLMDQGYKTAELFLQEGTLLQTKQRIEAKKADDPPEYSTTYFRLTPNGLVKSKSPDPAAKGEQEARMPYMVKKPTTVLINGGTGSAAEIFASALQDNGVATLVGTKSLGKGIGQSVFTTASLDDIPGLPENTWLKMTSFQYLTAKGKW